MIAKFSRIASIDYGKYLLLGTSLTSIVKTSVPLRQNINGNLFCIRLEMPTE